MLFRFIQDGGNAAQCLGHRLNGHIQAAIWTQCIKLELKSTTTGLEFLIWQN